MAETQTKPVEPKIEAVELHVGFDPNTNEILSMETNATPPELLQIITIVMMQLTSIFNDIHQAIITRQETAKALQEQDSSSLVLPSHPGIIAARGTIH